MQAPDSYRHASLLLLIAGCLNVFWGLLWSFGWCSATFSGVLCGPICCFVPLGLAVNGVIEARTGYRMMQGERVENAPNVALMAMIGSGMCFGFTMTMAELAALVLLKRPDVVVWLASPEGSPLRESALAEGASASAEGAPAEAEG